MVEVTRYISWTPTKVTVTPVKLNIDTSGYSSISSKINVQKLSESLNSMVKLNTTELNKSIQAASTAKLNAKVTQSLEASLAKFGASVENVGKTLDNKVEQVALPKVDLSVTKLKNNRIHKHSSERSRQCNNKQHCDTNNNRNKNTRICINSGTRCDTKTGRNSEN